MTTTVTNKEIVKLITAAFYADGSPIKKGKVARQKKALDVLQSEVSYYGQTVNGWDAYNCLLIIAYPNVDI